MTAEASRPAGRSIKVPWQSWWMVAALFVIYVFSWLDRLTISMMVAPIKQTLALTDFQMSVVLGPSFAIAYAVFGIPLGWAADRFSRRWVIFLGVFLWASATVACGFVASFEGLLICRVFVGIGEAALLPAAYSMIADEFPRERVTMATSVLQTAGKVGSATAFGLGGILIAFSQTLEHIDWPLHGPAGHWQITFAIIGLPGFLLMFLVFSFREPKRRMDVPCNVAQSSGQELLSFAKDNLALLGILAVAFSCLAIVGYSMTSWVPTYIDRRFGWGPERYGPALSLMNILGALSLVLNGWIVDRLFARGMLDVHLRFYSWLIIGLSPAILYAFFASNPYVFLAMYCLIQIITVPFIVYFSALLALLAPSRLRGQLLGIFMFIFNIVGFGAGPAIVGALTDFVFKDESKVGLSLAIVVISGAAIALIVMRLGLGRLNRAVEAAQRGAYRPAAIEGADLALSR